MSEHWLIVTRPLAYHPFRPLLAAPVPLSPLLILEVHGDQCRLILGSNVTSPPAAHLWFVLYKAPSRQGSAPCQAECQPWAAGSPPAHPSQSSPLPAPRLRQCESQRGSLIYDFPGRKNDTWPTRQGENSLGRTPTAEASPMHSKPHWT